MKAIVFGSTGFIGGHVTEQLHLAGHDVIAAVRGTSDTAFLESLGVKMVNIDFSDTEMIGSAIAGREVVYNCTADAKLHTQIGLDAPVEIGLTKTLAQAAASHRVARFVQLSTIVVYDFASGEPMDEAYLSHPEYPIQLLGLEREKVVRQLGRETGMETIVVRPASTIGARDRVSFFARLCAAHRNDQYPLVGDGSTQVSLVDTRDIGRAMVWLGSHPKPEDDDGVYLLKGFDTTWRELKNEIDRAAGRIAKTIDMPASLTEEQMKASKLNPFSIKTLTVDRLWDDSKIRRTGFRPMYTLRDAVQAAIGR